MDTDINLLFDGLLLDAFDRMPVSQRVRYAYAANVGLRPPDEDAIAAMVRSSTPDERLGLAMIFGPRPDLIASVLEYPDLRTGMWRLVQYMVPDPPPALEWILSPHGSPPPGVADHRVVAMANPVELATLCASALEDVTEETLRLAERCIERLQTADEWAAFGVGIARNQMWRTLEQRSQENATFARLWMSALNGVVRFPNRIVRCVQFGAMHPLFLSALRNHPDDLANVIRALGMQAEGMAPDITNLVVRSVISSNAVAPTLAAINVFGRRDDLIDTARNLGVLDEAIQTLATSPRLSREDIDRLPSVTWEMAQIVGHHRRLLAHAIQTRHATAYAVQFWDALSEDERLLIPRFAAREGDLKSLLRVPFERYADDALGTIGTLDMRSPQALSDVIAALRARCAQFGEESLATGLVDYIRTQAWSSDRGAVLWIAAGLPISPDQAESYEEKIATFAFDIARESNNHEWALSDDLRQRIGRALILAGNVERMIDALAFLGWEPSVVGAIIGDATSGQKVQADRAMACIRKLGIAQAWSHVPEPTATTLIAAVVREGKGDLAELIEICGAHPILRTQIAVGSSSSAMRRSPVRIARALRQYGDITDEDRDALAHLCPNNRITACELAGAIGHHEALARIAEQHRVLDMYFGAVRNSGVWASSLLTMPAARRWLATAACSDPKLMHAFLETPLDDSVFLTAAGNPSLMAALIVAGRIEREGVYGDIVRALFSEQPFDPLKTPLHSDALDRVLSGGDVVTRTAMRRSLVGQSSVIGTTAPDMVDAAVHLARLLKQPEYADRWGAHVVNEDIRMLLSVLKKSPECIDLLLQITKRVGRVQEIESFFHTLSGSWRERYQEIVGENVLEGGQVPLVRISEAIRRRRSMQ